MCQVLCAWFVLYPWGINPRTLQGSALSVNDVPVPNLDLGVLVEVSESSSWPRFFDEVQVTTKGSPEPFLKADASHGTIACM